VCDQSFNGVPIFSVGSHNQLKGLYEVNGRCGTRQVLVDYRLQNDVEIRPVRRLLFPSVEIYDWTTDSNLGEGE
jgi:hypothetical protein